MHLGSNPQIRNLFCCTILSVMAISPVEHGGISADTFAHTSPPAVHAAANARSTDPGLVWNTFLGGTDFDTADTMTTDESGSIYVAGRSLAAWGDPLGNHSGGVNDVFITKLDSSGDLLWNTFLGASDIDMVNGISVDGSGNIYVIATGESTWGDPVRPYTPPGPDAGNPADGFVAKLDLSGNLIWNTFLGGDDLDLASSIRWSPTGAVYVAGVSWAAWGCPTISCTVRPFTAVFGNAFVAQLDSSGNLLWNTFLAESNATWSDSMGVAGIAADASGVYVAGSSELAWGCSPDNCTVQSFGDGGQQFVARFDSVGNLVWNTFFGGTVSTSTSMSADANGNVYVAGHSSKTWGTPIRLHSNNPVRNDNDVYVARIDPSGALVWNTFLGGLSDDQWPVIASNASGNTYVAGIGLGTWGEPMMPCGPDSRMFVAKLHADGQLAWNSFLAREWPNGIALDSSMNLYMVGVSDATWGSPVRDYNGSRDGFVARLWPMAIHGNVGLARATLFYSDGVNKIATADASGNYTFTVPYNWSGTVRPAAAGYAFTPASLSYSGVLMDQAGQDYIAHALTTSKFRSIGSSDGWILESGENTDLGGRLDVSSVTLRLGDDASRRQYRSVLSFNTGGLPDNAVITSAVLTLTRKTVTSIDSDPLSTFGGLLVDVRKGYFGTVPGLQAYDFQGTAHINGLGPFAPPSVSRLYSISLLSAAFPRINVLGKSSGLTQLRLRFSIDDNNDSISNYISFFSGNAANAEDRPTLTISYYLP